MVVQTHPGGDPAVPLQVTVFHLADGKATPVDRFTDADGYPPPRHPPARCSAAHRRARGPRWSSAALAPVRASTSTWSTAPGRWFGYAHHHPLSPAQFEGLDPCEPDPMRTQPTLDLLTFSFLRNHG